jgi:hypothetical protein
MVTANQVRHVDVGLRSLVRVWSIAAFSMVSLSRMGTTEPEGDVQWLVRDCIFHPD